MYLFQRIYNSVVFNEQGFSKYMLLFAKVFAAKIFRPKHLSYSHNTHELPNYLKVF